MKPLLVVVIYTIATIVMGQVALRLMNNNKLVSLQRIYPISVEFAFGSVLLSVVWLLLALAGLLQSGIVWTVILFLGVIGITSAIRCEVRMLRTAGQSVIGRVRTDYVFSLLMLMALIITGWLGVLAWVRPPFGDADAFYMVYPKIIAATGELVPMAGGYRDFSTIGLSGELHFAALLAISTVAAAKLFAWVTGVGLLLLLRDLTRLVGGGMIAQGLSVVLLLTTTTFTDYLSDGKTDLFAALSGLAAIVCLRYARETVVLVSIAVAGVLAGFALTTKISYVIALLPAFVLLVAFQEFTRNLNEARGPRFMRAFKAIVIACCGLLIGSLPHLLKNQLLFGHALAPFFGMQGNWVDTPAWFSPADTIWIIATYPFALVYGLYPLMGGNMSFLWLAAIPLVMFIPRSAWSISNPLAQLSLSACVGIFCWLALKASVFAPRYILATLVMLIPLPAIAVEYVWRHESRPKLISIGFAMMAGIAMVAVPFTPPAGVWSAVPRSVAQHVRAGSPDCGLAISTYCHDLSSLNAETREGERVFVAGYYTYWLRPDLLQCINEPSDYGIFNLTNTSGIWSALYNNGFAHVAVQKYSHGKYLKMLDPTEAPPWLKVSTGLVDSDTTVFHLESLDPTRRPGIVCARKGRNSWAPAAMPSKAP